MRKSLAFVFASLPLVCAGADRLFISPLPSGMPVAWGSPVDGLAVGICYNTLTNISRTIPRIYFAVENRGDQEIKGVILSVAQCILAINGRVYAQESYGGPSSYMPPGRTYGPISINPEKLRRMPQLRAWPVIPAEGRAPSLRRGTNTMSVYYALGNKLIQSGEITVIAK